MCSVGNLYWEHPKNLIWVSSCYILYIYLSWKLYYDYNYETEKLVRWWGLYAIWYIYIYGDDFYWDNLDYKEHVDIYNYIGYNSDGYDSYDDDVSAKGGGCIT